MLVFSIQDKDKEHWHLKTRDGNGSLWKKEMFGCTVLKMSYLRSQEATRIHTSPTALTLFPRTNIPIGIPLRLGQLLMLWPEGPVFTTLYRPGPPRKNGVSCPCTVASCGQQEFISLKKSSVLVLGSWKFE